MPAVVVSGARVVLGGRVVLDGVDLTVAPGEWVSLIGPNGAGKSTLVRAVAGLVPAFGRGGPGGEIRLAGRAVEGLGHRERARLVALVPQLPSVPLGMSVEAYVLLGRNPFLGPLQRERASDRRIVGDLLADLELAEMRHRLLTTMSGGELQRVFLARALAQQPRILLLDEPTSALDLGHQQEVMELIDRLRRRLLLSVLSTMHDLTLAGQFADRLVVLDRGRVVADGAPGQVLTAAVVEQVYRAEVAIVDQGTVAGLRGPAVIGRRRPPSA